MATRQFKVQQVTQACSKFFQENDKNTNESREKLIQKHMNYTTWFSSKLKTRTREEAIEYLKAASDGGFDTLWYAVEDRPLTRMRIERIMAAASARHGSDYITLTTEEIRDIQPYLELVLS